MFRQLATWTGLLTLTQDLLFPPAAAATHPGTGESGKTFPFSQEMGGVGVWG